MLKRISFKYVAIVLCALLFILPVWWIAVSALRPEDDIFKYLSPLSLWTFLPKHVTFENIIDIWKGSFGLAIWNSIFISGVTLILGLLISASAAFALAVIEFPLRNFIFMTMVVSFLIPFDAIAVPLYAILRSWGLQNTYTGLILPGIGNGLAVFLLRQFFMGIPRELREAALVDGMSWVGIFFRIYIPLAVPALVSAALILFVFQWHAYLWPLLIAPDNQHKVAAVAIAQFSDIYETRYGQIFAAALFISLIPMIVLTVFQNHYSASLASTGGKE
ncbi:carbohydrate ABC transporter permease [uncultured Cohaesibacter sp.]|uniref:carbohydrate ABC transporter permease n=1 Tax=uncultured Cohaesibacter sp. TaxID=1002546 RepID=UPI0029C780C2|nr:carbohydrate ABC transporter permease [uncultured Cohaesibacter sp.]